MTRPIGFLVLALLMAAGLQVLDRLAAAHCARLEQQQQTTGLTYHGCRR